MTPFLDGNIIEPFENLLLVVEYISIQPETYYQAVPCQRIMNASFDFVAARGRK